VGLNPRSRQILQFFHLQALSTQGFFSSLRFDKTSGASFRFEGDTIESTKRCIAKLWLVRRNHRKETTETSETSEMKPPKQAKQPKRKTDTTNTIRNDQKKNKKKTTGQGKTELSYI